MWLPLYTGRVWDVEKTALEVQDYKTAVQYIAQTGLRDIIGKHELADLLQDRDKIAEDLQKLLDENTNPWGIYLSNCGNKRYYHTPGVDLTP